MSAPTKHCASAPPEMFRHDYSGMDTPTWGFPAGGAAPPLYGKAAESGQTNSVLVLVWYGVCKQSEQRLELQHEQRQPEQQQ